MPSMKLPNKTAPNVNMGSFVNVPALSPAIANLPQSVNTMAQNAAASVHTAANNMFKSASTSMGNLFTDSVAPLQESIQGSLESANSPFLTIPMVILIGVLVVALILFVKFKDQIVLAFELLLRKLHRWWNEKDGTPLPAAPLLPPPTVDAGAIDRMLPTHGKEVFHVSDNKYTYSDAEPLCKSLGAELATYDDVKKALQHGADWCSVGWSKGQQAVYPTQESTFQKLQQGPEDQRMACGMPGMNGGYRDNPELRFGVNCIGTKPQETDKDRRAISKNGALSPGALAYDKKVNDFKNHANEIPLAPFHSGSWNA